MSTPTPASGSTGKAPTTTRIAGGYGNRRAAAGVIPHGHVSAETCDTVFRSAITAWGLSGSTEAARDDLLWAIAETLAYGTSSEISWSVVTFSFNGDTLSMAVLFDAASTRIPFANPIRVWVRDFRKAEVAVRISELLRNPDNIEMRQTCAANYGTGLENARFCFDTAHALTFSGMALSHADTMLIGQLSAMAITRSQDDAVSRGFAQATSNHAGTVGGSKPAPQIAPSPSTTPAERGGFKAVR